MDSSGMVLMPGGVRDLLPGEARRKRELENRLIGLFRTWGYQEVVTPTFEYYDVLAPALGKLLPDQLYRFIDEQGRIMVLRPDMTTPIARMMSTRLQGRELPQRYCYAASVFRRENHAGGQREFFQAGVELLGAGGPAADAEVIGLAAAALELAGIKDFRITVGHVEVLAGVLRGAGFSEAEQEQAKIALGSKDLVAWERLVLKSRLPQDRKKVLASLPYRNGGIEVLERVRDLIKDDSAQASLESLSRVWESLADFGFQGRAGIDLTLLRGLEYYTGIVFECYAAGVGYPLCGGGRYDCLLSKFGPSLPATGFALVIDRLLAALERQSTAVEEQVPDYFITGDDLRSVFRKAKELREEGFIVEVDVSERPRREAIAYASRKGIPQILVIENSETVER